MLFRSIQEKPSITTKQLVELTGISNTTLERDIKTLKTNGVIKRVGSRKTGYWAIGDIGE